MFYTVVCTLYRIFDLILNLYMNIVITLIMFIEIKHGYSLITDFMIWPAGKEVKRIFCKFCNFLMNPCKARSLVQRNHMLIQYITSLLRLTWHKISWSVQMFKLMLWLVKEKQYSKKWYLINSQCKFGVNYLVNEI